jgi:probable addiction module antidote protein
MKKSTGGIKSTSYQDYLIESLKNPEEAAGYLNVALSSGDVSVFLLALQNVVQAHGGITMLASKIHKSRTSLYKSLSETGNPYLKSANEILSAMDMHLAVMPNKGYIAHAKTPIIDF